MGYRQGCAEKGGHVGNEMFEDMWCEMVRSNKY